MALYFIIISLSKRKICPNFCPKYVGFRGGYQFGSLLGRAFCSRLPLLMLPRQMGVDAGNDFSPIFA